MPRTARAAKGGVIYHISNRGNGRGVVFRKRKDYEMFMEILEAGRQRASIEVFGFCLMPTHWHLVVRPRRDGDLSAYLSWITNTHVKRHRVRYPHTRGRLYHGRYKSFPVQSGRHLVNLMRYVESNPQRAKLKKRAENWSWSSLGCDKKVASALLDPWPADRPKHWRKLVGKSLKKSDRDAVVASLKRSRPLGEDRWVTTMARKTGSLQTLHPIGRPPRQATKAK